MIDTCLMNPVTFMNWTPILFELYYVSLGNGNGNKTLMPHWYYFVQIGRVSLGGSQLNLHLAAL